MRGPNSATKPWEDSTLAANGRQVRENFNDWFAGSRVVDAAGLPRVVYHGTPAVFTEFDERRGRGGIYLSGEPDVALAYAVAQDAFDDHGVYVDQQPNVMPLWVSMTNPLVLDEAWAVENLGPTDDREWTYLDTVVYQAAEAGHDGVILRGVIDFVGMDADRKRQERAHDQFVVFRAEQLKSAVGNSGLYQTGPMLCDEQIAESPAEDESARPRERA